VKLHNLGLAIFNQNGKYLYPDLTEDGSFVSFHIGQVTGNVSAELKLVYYGHKFFKYEWKPVVKKLCESKYFHSKLGRTFAPDEVPKTDG
jgi:hypothetical protein